MVEKTSVYPGGTRLDAAAKSAVRPLSPLSEDEVLALIDRLFPSRTEHVPDGRGDDCAELALAGSGPVKGGDLTSPRLALSTDLFLEDVHFSFGYCTPEEVGAKALAAAVSDLAAAGAVPLGFSLGLILPPALALAGLNSLLKGMAAQAASFDMALSGGDLIRGEKLGLSVTVWGRPPDAGTPFLRRGGVRAGHCIFLIGDAGLARVGLWALQREGRQALASWPSACAAHLGAKPLLAQGQAIARLVRYEADAKKNGDASARVSLMDVSDGLARDLPRLLGGLGADLDFDAAIIPPEVTAAAPFMGMAAEDIFLLGGEDYALAGACSGRMWTGLTQAMPEARLIGRVRPEAGLFLRGKRLDLEGFDHFSPHQGPRGGGAENAAETTAFSTASSVGGRAWPPLPRPARKAMAALVACGREAWRAGLMAGFNGNISCRVTLEDGSQACLITRSGAAKARLGENDFSLLSLPDGKAIQGPPPSTESPVHLGIYRACPRSAAVLHIHPPKLLALSLTLPKEQRLDLPLPEAESCRVQLAFTAYYAPGSSELGLEAAGAAAEHPAIWLERHGLVTHGSDLAFALSLAEELEQLAGVQLEMLRTPKQKTALP